MNVLPDGIEDDHGEGHLDCLAGLDTGKIEHEQMLLGSAAPGERIAFKDTGRAKLLAQ